MHYSGLYRCSGCSVTFSDPESWRRVVDPLVLLPSAVGKAVSQTLPTAPVSPVPPLFATWGGVPQGPADPNSYGTTETDLKVIREAAARANKSKGHRR